MSAFPITDQSPITYPGPPPKQADVVVIGGGVIGVTTAWELARKGLRVVVVEKGRIAGEQSSRNWGWIRAQGRDPAELPIAMAARDIWRELQTELDQDIGLQQTGTLYLASKASDLDGYARWLPHAQENGLDSEILDAKAVAAKLPASTSPWHGGLWTPSDMRGEPWLAVPALARAAARAGVTFVENCAVRLLDIEAGKINGVVTESGRIAAPKVVLCGGAWSSLLLRRHGINIPQLSVRATVGATTPMNDVYPGGAVDHQLAWRRRTDGGYSLAPEGFHEFFIGPDAFRHFFKYLPTLLAEPLATRLYPFAPRHYPDSWLTARNWGANDVSPFEKMRVLNPSPNLGAVRRLARDFAATFPGQGPVAFARTWAGMIDSLPDMVPVVDHAAALPGLTIATGMCGHGFGIGPAFGRIVSRLVTGDDPGFDMTAFRLDRSFKSTGNRGGPQL